MRTRQGSGFLAVALAACLAPAAHAQVSATAGLQSDYRFRGISLSSRQPVGSLSPAYDHASGAYAGGSLILEQHGGLQGLGTIAYAGYATPKALMGMALDMGLTRQSLSEYAGRRYALNYSEAYVGVIGSRMSAHLSYSPDYLRTGYRSLYADVEGALKPADDWWLFAHLGATLPLADAGPPRRRRYDLKAGISRQFHNLQVQAIVTATTPAPPFPSPQDRTALVFGASYSF
jgi:uncharacterized protein (TIGR02001 family)